MDKISIVYFGTSDHSVILLDHLLISPLIKVEFVITKNDVVIGRNKILSPTPVKQWCLNNGVEYITTDNLKSVHNTIKLKVEQKKIKLGLVADFGLMIPSPIINSFEKGVVNIHFSLLPKYRGASPVTYTILNGDQETGITYLLTTSKMDKGDIIEQIKVPTTGTETDESLYKTLFELAGESTPQVLKNYYDSKLKLRPQDEEQATYCTPSQKFDRTTYITREDAKLDLKKRDDELERAIRAYFPWPVAWASLAELAQYLQKELREPSQGVLKVKIYKAHLKDATLIIDEVQVEAKNKTDFNSFKNGYLA